MLSACSVWSVCLPLIAGILNYKHIERNVRIILLILLLAAVPQVATIINSEYQLPVVFYNSYILAEAALWPLFFYRNIAIPRIRQWIISLLLLNLVPVLTIYIVCGIRQRFYHELVCYNSLLQTILIALYFYELNNRTAYVRLWQQRLFWISIGLLYYAPCTFFLFLFYTKVNAYYGRSDLHFLWDIHSCFNVLMYILFTIGLIIPEDK